MKEQFEGKYHFILDYFWSDDVVRKIGEFFD